MPLGRFDGVTEQVDSLSKRAAGQESATTVVGSTGRGMAELELFVGAAGEKP